MPVGGRTPLSAGLAIPMNRRNYLLKEPTARPIENLITDCKSNVPWGLETPSTKPWPWSRRSSGHRVTYTT
jgi:magnesium chelatase subunit D